VIFLSPDIAVNLDGCHLIRKDRSSGPDGGVAVYISSNVTCCELSSEHVDDSETLWSVLRLLLLFTAHKIKKKTVIFCYMLL